MTKAVFSCAESNSFLAAWDEARGDAPVPSDCILKAKAFAGLRPRMAAFAQDGSGMVRFTFMGRDLVELLGGDYTGSPVYGIFNAFEREDIDRMHGLMFAAPVIVGSLSEVPTYQGRMTVVEQVQLPERMPSGELQYVSLVSQAYDPLVFGDDAGGDASRRKLLWRRALDVETLEPIDTEISAPRQTLPEFPEMRRTVSN